MYIDMYVYVYRYVYMYMYIDVYTHTHAHTRTLFPWRTLTDKVSLLTGSEFRSPAAYSRRQIAHVQ